MIDQQEFYKTRVASKDVSGYYLIKHGEFAYNKSSSDGNPFGVVRRLDRYSMGVLSTLYIVFGLKDNAVVSDFFSVYFGGSTWYKDIAKKVAEGARNHGLLNISTDDFFTLKCKLPTPQEQHRIAELFSALDCKIGRQGERLEKLRHIKQALLAKMFANTTHTPQLRFREFHDEWEEKCLGEIGKLLTGFPFDGHAYTNKGVRVLRGENIGSGFLHWEKRIDKRWNESTEKLNKYWLTKGDVVMQMDCYIGKNIAQVDTDEPILLAQRVACLREDSTNSIKYMYYSLQTDAFKQYLSRVSAGSIIMHVSLNQISNFSFSLPTPQEQRRIAELFTTLDKLIAAEEQKHTKLKQLKQALLNNLFPQT